MEITFFSSILCASNALKYSAKCKTASFSGVLFLKTEKPQNVMQHTPTPLFMAMSNHVENLCTLGDTENNIAYTSITENNVNIYLHS